MAVIVHLNDIFGMTVIKNRMEHAFGKNGEGFWENFLPCEGRHPDVTVVYLFTEYQLKTLHEYLTQKTRELGERTEENLRFSRQRVFRNAVADQPESAYGFKVRTCCITYNGYDPGIKRVYFHPSPQDKLKKEKRLNDFFDGKFTGVEPVELKEEDKRQKKISELLSIRRLIENEFGGPERNDSKWVRYLGPRIRTKDYPYLDYCVPPCPVIVQPPPNASPNETDKVAV